MIFSKLVVSAFISIVSVTATDPGYQARDLSNAHHSHNSEARAYDNDIFARGDIPGVVENCCSCMGSCCEGYSGCTARMQSCGCSIPEITNLISEMNSHMSMAINEGSRPLLARPQDVGRFIVRPFVQSVEIGSPVVLAQVSNKKLDTPAASQLKQYHSLVNELISEAKRYDIDTSTLTKINKQLEQHIVRH